MLKVTKHLKFLKQIKHSGSRVQKNDPYKAFDILCYQEGIAYLNRGQVYEMSCASHHYGLGMRGPKILKQLWLIHQQYKFCLNVYLVDLGATFSS